MLYPSRRAIAPTSGRRASRRSPAESPAAAHHPHAGRERAAADHEEAVGVEQRLVEIPRLVGDLLGVVDRLVSEDQETGEERRVSLAGRLVVERDAGPIEEDGVLE